MGWFSDTWVGRAGGRLVDGVSSAADAVYDVAAYTITDPKGAIGAALDGVGNDTVFSSVVNGLGTAGEFVAEKAYENTDGLGKDLGLMWDYVTDDFSSAAGDVWNAWEHDTIFAYSVDNPGRAFELTGQGLWNSGAQLVGGITDLGSGAIRLGSNGLISVSNWGAADGNKTAYITGSEVSFADRFEEKVQFVDPIDLNSEDRNFERFFLFGGEMVGDVAIFAAGGLAITGLAGTSLALASKGERVAKGLSYLNKADNMSRGFGLTAKGIRATEGILGSNVAGSLGYGSRATAHAYRSFVLPIERFNTAQKIGWGVSGVAMGMEVGGAALSQGMNWNEALQKDGQLVEYKTQLKTQNNDASVSDDFFGNILQDDFALVANDGDTITAPPPPVSAEFAASAAPESPSPNVSAFIEASTGGTPLEEPPAPTEEKQPAKADTSTVTEKNDNDASLQQPGNPMQQLLTTFISMLSGNSNIDQQDFNRVLVQSIAGLLFGQEMKGQFDNAAANPADNEPAPEQKIALSIPTFGN